MSRLQGIVPRGHCRVIGAVAVVVPALWPAGAHASASAFAPVSRSPIAALRLDASRPTAPEAEAGRSAISVLVAGGGDTSIARVRPGMAATVISLPLAESVAASRDGGFLLVTACKLLGVSNGVVARIAGDGECAFHGDGGPVAQAGLESPGAVEATADDGFLLADGNRVRRITPDGRIVTVAGNGSNTFSGDGGPAVHAGLEALGDIAVLPDGGFLVIDGDRVRRVDSAGIITTVAGTGRSGFSGDGGPASRARLSIGNDATLSAGGLAALPGGGFLVADDGNHRVREVDPGGLIHTVAGDGRQGASGDGGPATRARLTAPLGLLTNADGSWLVGDVNGTIRRVAPDGTISTVVGSRRGALMLTGHGIGIFNGEGLAASHAAVVPVDLARAGDGSLLIANGRGRVLAITGPLSSLPAVAITATHVSPKRLTVEFISTVSGRAHLAVTQRGRASRDVDAEISPGRARVGVPVPSRPGVYRAELTVRGATAAPPAATVGLLVGPLQAGIARHAVYRYADASEESNGHIKTCHRFGARRIDCENRDDGEFCLSMNAVTVGDSGLVRFRNYDCPRHGQARFRQRPRYWTRVSDGTFPPFGRLGVMPGPLLGPIL
jgi:hypothetical protein